MISVQSLFKISLDWTSAGLFCLLRKEKAEVPCWWDFFSPPLCQTLFCTTQFDEVNQFLLSVATRTCCLPLRSRCLVSLVQHVGCFCTPSASALLLWQLCTPKMYVGAGSCSFCGGQHCAELTTDKASRAEPLLQSHFCEKLSILPVPCSNLLWNQEREWTTKLQRSEPVPVVPLANSFLPQAVKNNATLPLPLTNSNHFYKQILRANKNILEVLKCWFTSCSGHKGNKGLEIKTVFTVLSKMGKGIMATQIFLDKLCLQLWVYAWLPRCFTGVNFCQY